MKKPISRAARLLAPAALLVLLAACNVAQPAQDDPTRYYLLSDSAGAPPPAAATAGLKVGLRGIRLEPYLKHREMVVRSGENEVAFQDYRLWAEPLDQALTHLVKARLISSPGVGEVISEPFPIDKARDFDVSIEVRRCEGLTGRSGSVASFSAIIEVSTTGDGAHLVARRTFTAPDAAWDGSNFDRLAGLLSADAAQLGAEVASTLETKN